MGSLLAALTMLTRLPWPGARHRAFTAVELAGTSRWFGLVGAVIGVAVGGTILLLRGWWPPLVVGLLAVTVEVVISGALHLDGLADCADGCGGRTADERLRIMKDHAIGVYGTVAVVLAMGLRTVLLAAIAWQPWPILLAATVVAWTLSRLAMLMPAGLLSYAREQGTGRAVVVGLTRSLALQAVAISLPVLVCGLWVLNLAPVLAAVAAVLVGAGVVTGWAGRHLGGVTGDVLGATAEGALLLALLGLVGAAG